MWIGSYPPVEGVDVEKGFTLMWRHVDASVSRELAEKALAGGGLIYYAKVSVSARKQGKKPLYTHGDVVSLMKQRGIGRPSTYAKIIETLITRRYVIEVPRSDPRFLNATRRGILVYNYLTHELAEARGDEYGRLARVLSRVPQLVSEERTRQLEKAMSEIEEGLRSRVEVLSEIHDEIKELLEAVALASERPRHLKSGEAPPRVHERGDGNRWLEEFRSCVSKARQSQR